MSLGWVALFAASVAVAFVFFGFFCFPLASPYVVEFSCFSSCSSLRGKEDGTLFLSVVVVGLPCGRTYCKLTTSTINTADVLKSVVTVKVTINRES